MRATESQRLSGTGLARLDGLLFSCPSPWLKYQRCIYPVFPLLWSRQICIQNRRFFFSSFKAFYPSINSLHLICIAIIICFDLLCRGLKLRVLGKRWCFEIRCINCELFIRQLSNSCRKWMEIEIDIKVWKLPVSNTWVVESGYFIWGAE